MKSNSDESTKWPDLFQRLSRQQDVELLDDERLVDRSRLSHVLLNVLLEKAEVAPPIAFFPRRRDGFQLHIGEVYNTGRSACKVFLLPSPADRKCEQWPHQLTEAG